MTDTNGQNKTKVVTPDAVRLSYCHLFEPYVQQEGQEPKYSVLILIPKTAKRTLARIKAAQEAAVELGVRTRWGGKRPKNLGNTLHDGDSERDEPEYEGMYFMNVSSRLAPTVVDMQCNRITDSTEVYSGCWGHVSMNFFPYSNSGNNGISAGLNNVQFVRDGDPLGGRSRAEDDFAEFAGDDGYDDDDALL